MERARSTARRRRPGVRPRESRDGVGVWTPGEHDRFLEAQRRFPKGPWKLVAQFVGTRSTRQTMTHAQKFRQKLQRRTRGLRRYRRVTHAVGDSNNNNDDKNDDNNNNNNKSELSPKVDLEAARAPPVDEAQGWAEPLDQVADLGFQELLLMKSEELAPTAAVDDDQLLGCLSFSGVVEDKQPPSCDQPIEALDPLEPLQRTCKLWALEQPAALCEFPEIDDALDFIINIL